MTFKVTLIGPAGVLFQTIESAESPEAIRDKYQRAMNATPPLALIDEGGTGRIMVIPRKLAEQSFFHIDPQSAIVPVSLIRGAS